jgi:hypothetical protein
VFRYNHKINPSSRIQAEYLLSTFDKDRQIFIFLDINNNDDYFFCHSFFPKDHIDYTIGQPAYTLLYKEKIIISTGEKVVQYDRLSPLPQKLI